MDTSFFNEKQAKYLEDQFFLNRDKKLMEELRKIREMKETKQALAEVSGISDDEVLQKLVELNVRPEILATLALIPLIEVAWADGHVDEKEKKAVLDASGKSFVAKDSIDYNLLNCWLDSKPDERLLDAWILYMKGLCEKLSDTQKHSLKNDLISHVRAVASAAGGFLGLGNKISEQERLVIEKMESVFK